MRSRRSLLSSIYFRFAMFAVSMGLSHAAGAVEKYATIPLPDAGQGSTARAVAQTGSLNYAAVGSQRGSDGKFSPVVWSIAVDPSDPSGNTVYATQLPKPSGSSTEATDVAFLEGDPDRPVIVGSAYIGSANGGVWKTTLWRQNNTGQFTYTLLDSEVESQANAISVRNTPVGLIIVVCGRFRLANGDWHACLWRVGQTGAQRTDLGTLGGQNSEANDLIAVDDLVGWNIVGSAQGQDGREIATLWTARLMEEEGIYYFIHALPTPPGEQSHAEAITPSWTDHVYLIQGNRIGTDGTTSANIWINQGEIPASVLRLRAPAGYRHSTARGVIVHGLGGDDLIVVGSAWNSETDRTGMGALYRPDIKDIDIFRFDTMRRTETVGLNESITVGINRAGRRSGALVGESRGSNTQYPQATLFLPTPREVPNIIAILIGIASRPDARRAGIDVTSLWQQDGKGLPVRTGSDKTRVAVEFEFQPLSPPSAERTPKRLTVSGKIIPSKPSNLLSWTVESQVYSNTFAVWITVGQFVASNAYFQKTIDIPDADRFLLSSTEPLRTRLVVTQLTGAAGQDWFFIVDHIDQDDIYL